MALESERLNCGLRNLDESKSNSEVKSKYEGQKQRGHVKPEGGGKDGEETAEGGLRSPSAF